MARLSEHVTKLPEHYDFGFVKMRAKYGKMQMEDGKLSIPVDMTCKWRRGRLWLFRISYRLLIAACSSRARH